MTYSFHPADNDDGSNWHFSSIFFFSFFTLDVDTNTTWKMAADELDVDREKNRGLVAKETTIESKEAPFFTLLLFSLFWRYEDWPLCLLLILECEWDESSPHSSLLSSGQSHTHMRQRRWRAGHLAADRRNWQYFDIADVSQISSSLPPPPDCRRRDIIIQGRKQESPFTWFDPSCNGCAKKWKKCRRRGQDVVDSAAKSATFRRRLCCCCWLGWLDWRICVISAEFCRGGNPCRETSDFRPLFFFWDDCSWNCVRIWHVVSVCGAS